MTFWGWLIVSIFSVIGLFIVAKVITEIVWNKRLNQFKTMAQVAPSKMPVERLIKYAYSFSLSAAVVLVSAVSGVFVPSQTTVEINKTLVNAHVIGSKARLDALIDEYRISSDDYWLFPEAMNDALDGAPEAGGGDRDYTDTNVQVDGVDEGDVLKTDGYRVFYAPRYYNVIEVLDIEDDHTMTHIESMVMDDFRVDSLYLTDDYLVVIGYRYQEYIYPMATLDAYWGFYFYEQTASVVVFDKDTLEEVYRLDTDLSFIDHRMIDNTLYVVSTKWFYEDQEARPYFDTTVDGITSTSYLSYMDMYYFEDVPASSMTVISTLDVSSFDLQSQGFIGQTAQIYVTENSIYTFSTAYAYEEIEPDTYTYEIYSHIVKYSINDIDHSIDYVASVNIEGLINDRYWLDESGDYLRVVTSRSWWDNTNRLYILEENELTDTFDQVALMDEHIGHENERVESVRFHGDYVNIVTFERMDPLYTIDLSSPEEPVILDHPIEEAGYSEYLHIWDEPHHVIGLGYLDADANGQIDGMKLSAYDTTTGTILETDPYPHENGSGWSYSYTEALWNPKALMVDVNLGLFGFPMVSYQFDDDSWEYQYKTSFVVYQIDFDRGAVLGEPIIIAHETTNWYNQIDRGVWINGYVYTFSAHEILSYHLESETPFESIYISYDAQ